MTGLQIHLSIIPRMCLFLYLSSSDTFFTVRSSSPSPRMTMTKKLMKMMTNQFWNANNNGISSNNNELPLPSKKMLPLQMKMNL